MAARLLALFVCWMLCTYTLFARADTTVHGSGALVLHHPDGRQDALLLTANMDLRVNGLLADMTLVQTFQNTSDQWLTGSYLFPLPDKAAVRGLRITVGERNIVGRIQPRQLAEAEFEQAAKAGQIASLMEQQRPNLFTMQVANIAPGAHIEVTLDIMLPVHVNDRQMSLILPTTLTPRYVNWESTHREALQTPFVHPLQAQGPTLNVNLQIAPLDSYESVNSSTHSLQHGEMGVRIIDMPMDQDVEISWPVHYPAVPQTQAFVAEHEGKRYVQLLVNPPEQALSSHVAGRELVIIVDKSGSMAGVSMRAAIEALNYAIDDLTDDDLLNIVAFDDRYYPLFEHARVASDAVRRQARQFANQLQADGGTEMAAALSFALRGDYRNHSISGEDPESTAAPTREERLKQVVFITDGSIAYEDKLLNSIRQHLGNSRLFTVGIGPAPNHWFLEKAAEAGRGASVSIQDEHDVADAITQLLNGLRYPVLTDIAVQYPSGHGEIYPRPIPDLYANRPAMWITRIDRNVDSLVITGTHDGKRFRENLQLPAASADTSTALAGSAPSIAMHWARRKVSSLEDEQRYAADRHLNRQAITQLAMETGLMTQYTSFIAVDQTPVRPEGAPLSENQIANRIPSGNQMMHIALPRSAAGIDTLLWISLLLGCSGIALLRVSNRVT